MQKKIIIKVIKNIITFMIVFELGLFFFQFTSVLFLSYLLFVIMASLVDLFCVIFQLVSGIDIQLVYCSRL